jgi:hypothetical protein
MNTYEQARQKYLPDKIRVLFIAEAPPENVERFFYYENVKDHDVLFVNLVRTLYPEYQAEHGGEVSDIRDNKSVILERFKKDGYFLIDAMPEPISLELSSREREKMITFHQQAILENIKKLKPEVGVVLVKSTVYNGLCTYLVNQGVPILNNSSVPFPSHGHSGEFRRRIHEALATNDEKYRWCTKFVWYDGDIEVTEPGEL